MDKPGSRSTADSSARPGVKYRLLTAVKKHAGLLALLREFQSGGFHRKLTRDPLNPSLHLAYALHAAKRGKNYLAFAELKTAALLGAELGQIQSLAPTFRQALPPRAILNHNQYFRFETLARALATRTGDAAASVLDVGGGHGYLAAFLPDIPYCLAEPSVNGISGVDLPFADRAFDYVISCHVLEHVEPSQRDRFLDQLVAKAKRGVILLNPFDVPGTSVDERLRLFIDITGAQWAREHLECSLPRVDDLTAYAASRGLALEVRPSGTVTTTTALVFLDYFAAKVGNPAAYRRINEFFNTRCMDIQDSSSYPTAYLIHLDKP